MRLSTLLTFSFFVSCSTVLHAQTGGNTVMDSVRTSESSTVGASIVTIGKNDSTDARGMEEVSVTGLTAAQKAARQSYNIAVIDATKLYNTTLDISHALDRVSGVRIREDGGVGSRTSISLNGFTGRQVRIFIDGVPMDNFGSSFQLNNIPINLAERVEVFKGVVPIWLGSDALGGAINIVTSTKARSYLDASYSFGSFNTHRTAINAGYTAKSGFTLQLNAFQNYSDNNYWVNVDVADINTGRYYKDQRVRRFHDQYRNETIIASVGVLGKKWADQLLVGVTLGQNYREIQTGARLVTVFGGVHTRGNIVMPSMRYVKTNFLVKGLDLRITGNYNLGEEIVADTVARRYNWFGESKEFGAVGGERERSLYTYRNNNGIATANLSYQLGERHSFMLNHVMNVFNRKGYDPLYPESAKYDQPQLLTKNITGLGYRFDFHKRWSTSAFFKNFEQVTRYAQSYNPSGNWGDVAYADRKTLFNAQGYGIASSYFITPDFQVKASYERGLRMPESQEVYGDATISYVGNLNLKPEQSGNYNLGVSAKLLSNDDHRIFFNGNALYRDSKDFIRQKLATHGLFYEAINDRRVTNVSFDGDLRYSFRKLLNAGASLTYQNLRNKTRFEEGSTTESPLYNDRMPNMPFLFGNADVSVTVRNFPAKGHTISAGYNLLYVHAYYLYWPSMGADKLDIPMQLSHDANLVWITPGGRYNVALECRNLTDARLYDNFSLQKPSRAFSVKLRYFIQKIKA